MIYTSRNACFKKQSEINEQKNFLENLSLAIAFNLSTKFEVSPQEDFRIGSS